MTLVGHICQMPGPPRFVAEHMATALLAPFGEFTRLEGGAWALKSGAYADLLNPSSEDPLAARHSTLATPHSPLAVRQSLLDLSYVVVDTETTGGQPERGHRITEVAAVVVRNGEVEDIFETLVNPERPIPPYVTRLTNISWEMVRHAPRFRDIAPRLAEVLAGHVFVAHNATFDWKFVGTELGWATGQRLVGRKLCTVRLARRLLPQLPRRSLDHVARHYGVEISGRHRAGGDALATARVLIRMLRDATDLGCLTWPDLEALMRVPSRKKRRRRRSGMPTWGSGE